MFFFLALAYLVSSQAPEPWLPLHGGSFSGPSQASSPDPLVRYLWGGGLNDTESLQYYFVYPVSVSVMSGPVSFSDLTSLLDSPGANALVTGEGGFLVDFGVESPGWIEFDSPDLSPSDLPLLSLGLSEWREPLTNKWRVPVSYASQGTYRLETNKELYEGVRFGFFNVSGTPSAPFHITSFRCVAQAKPVNYTGSFSVPNPLLTRVWYTGAYTVRTNLERDYFGAVLIDRGDRIAWTGDSHVAQAVSMVAFGNFFFVRKNLDSSKDNCNGIESYCIYWVLSLCDYYEATHDGDALAVFSPEAEKKLLRGEELFTNLNAQWEFYGWDDRLGSGFMNASCTESQWDYRFLTLRAFHAWSSILKGVGNSSGAALWDGYARAGATWLRANLPSNLSLALGVHSAAEALTVLLPDGSPFLTPEETYTLLEAT